MFIVESLGIGALLAVFGYRTGWFLKLFLGLCVLLPLFAIAPNGAVVESLMVGLKGLVALIFLLLVGFVAGFSWLIGLFF